MPANGAVLADLADREERPAVRRHRSRRAGRRWATWSGRQWQTGGTSKLRTGRATWEGHPVYRSFVVFVTDLRRIVTPQRPARFHDPQDFESALATTQGAERSLGSQEVSHCCHELLGVLEQESVPSVAVEHERGILKVLDGNV